MNTTISDIAAVTSNFPDGQKLTGIQITFDQEPESISRDRISIPGKELTGMRQNGKILELSLKPERLIPPPKPRKTSPAPQGNPNVPDMPPAVRLVPKAAVVLDGVSFETTRSIEPVVEDFRQMTLNGMHYNLYIPNLIPGEKYPLVLFIHDAGACGSDPKITLSQGNGAVGFASPEWQAEHPCFVLAPQIDKEPYGPMTSDDFKVTPDFDRLYDILMHVIREYPVDSQRIYTTGQSMGCMASCELNIRHPDLFAASLLVAGQWDPVKMAEKCSSGQYWILVSQGDAKAFPGMNAVTQAMASAGAVVKTYFWDAKEDNLEQLASLARQEQCNVHYTVFTDSSVVPDGVDPNPGMNHMCTWPAAYEIRELKKWMFSCVKK